MTTDAAPGLFHPDGRLCLEAFTSEAVEGLQAALAMAGTTHWETVRTPHVFMGLLDAADQSMTQWCEKVEIDREQLLGQFLEAFQEKEIEPPPKLALHREFLSDNLLRLLREAQKRAEGQERITISSLDMLAMMFEDPHGVVGMLLEKEGFPSKELVKAISVVEVMGR